MPLVGSSSYGSVAAINTLVRSLVNDSAGNWATDAVLLPYLNDIYLTLQKKVANAGGAEFITDNVQLVIAAVPALQQDPGTQVVLNDASAPPNQLPSNLLLPLKLWERPNLSTQDFVEMVDLTEHGGLPSRPQGASLCEWEWRTDGIYFVGATQDTQIRLRYEQVFAPLVGPNDIIQLRGAQNCLAHGTAALAGMARGSPLAEQMETLFTDSVEDVIVENVRRQQNTGVRRKPFRGHGYNWRRGGYL